MTNSKRFFVCFAGIFLSYLLFGIFQESMLVSMVFNRIVCVLFENRMKTKYGNRRFTSVTCLVLVQSAFNVLVAKIVKNKTISEDPLPFYYYAASALTYMTAMICSNRALNYVSYPMQVIGKSTKPISVMVLGVLVARKRYPIRRYICVLAIVAGVAMFMYDGKRSGPTSNRFGYALIVVSLVCDGLTGAIQDVMRSKTRLNAYDLMMAMNLWSVLWSFIGVAILRETQEFLGLISQHPVILAKILLLSASGASGQIFIFLTVEWFGPLMCSVFTTTRKFFTILCSVILFGNPLTLRQWTGTALVFSGLVVDSFAKKKK